MVSHKSRREDQEVERRRRGRNAEKRVAAILSELSKTRYAVLNDAKARYGNIDHLVVSRVGALFLIETKSYRGRIRVENEQILLNGKPPKVDVIAQINRNILWLREKIKNEVGVNPWIVAIAVFPNAIVYSAKGKPVLKLPPVKRINVVTTGYLKRFIDSYSPRIPHRVIWQKVDIFSKE